MAQHATKPEERDEINSGNGNGVKYKVFQLPNSQIEIEIEVTTDRFNEVKETVYKNLAPQTNVAGFRQGKAPRRLLEAKLGARLFEDTINRLVPLATSEIINELKFRPLDYAQYKVKELKPDFSLLYSAIFTIFPDIVLPDFKKLKLKKDKVEVPEKDIEDLFTKLKTEVEEGMIKKAEREAKIATEDSADKDATETVEKKAEKVEIDWETELGQKGIKTEEDVKKVLRENVQKRKEADAEEKFMADLVKEAIILAKIESPKNLVHDQVHKREHSYEDRIVNLGLKLDDFLKAQKTSIEELRKSWEDEAKFQIAADMLFMSIADKHDLKVVGDEIDKEVSLITDPKLKLEYETEQGRNNIATILMRQKAIDKLKELAGIV